MSTSCDLSVCLGPLRLRNPLMTASGTCGYGEELADFIPPERLGALVVKTVTLHPRAGNPTPRVAETPAGLLNAIGLENCGLESFCRDLMPRISKFDTVRIVNIAGYTDEEWRTLAAEISACRGVDALELNDSCPNVRGGLAVGTSPRSTRRVVRLVRKASRVPILVKLTPNVTSVARIASAAVDAGADILTMTNTLLGMAVDWRRRRPVLANVTGGLSGPCIKPIALRMIHEVRRAVDAPLVGVGGIRSAEDAMEFFVTGASAVQVGTATFVEPRSLLQILDDLPARIAEIGARSLREIVGILETERRG